MGIIKNIFNRSPEPVGTTSVKQINFYEAIREVMAGRKVTKLDWGSNDYYGVLNETKLQLHKPDGKLYDWILSEGDISGKDYVII